MKLVEISVGKPRDVQWRGRRIQTSIFKTPLSRRVHVARGNVEGDEQSDLSVHGGPEKAVYAYRQSTIGIRFGQPNHCSRMRATIHRFPPPGVTTSESGYGRPMPDTTSGLRPVLLRVARRPP